MFATSSLLLLLLLVLPLTTVTVTSLTIPETTLMKTLTSKSSKTRVESAIEEVVNSPPDPIYKDPATNPKLNGLWELIYQTAPTTSSPVQRFLTTSLKANDLSESIPYSPDSSVKIYQQVNMVEGKIDIIVKPKGSSSNLTVTALSGSLSKPPPNWTERENDGKLLGLNILGVSKTNTDPPNTPYGDVRVIFLFDTGSFNINDQIKIPYPVPFRSRLFRDNVKGWLDHIYLSEDIRICQGNKGTTFVLKRVPE
ncbi:hypothetical protein TrST_g3125 [Triparma strigata]|uniref:Plastid lipid-associated protein/fibrillin conserved domain-containing protein n=1 Tax=Triparma strigata TaxID=1606541 RepID=A0A9W7F474_9STRA|nr:hypothetical protein TrST_g3125 [Triparma strigata]